MPVTTTTTEIGLEFVGSVASELKKLQEEVVGLQEATKRLRVDLALESKLRGADVSNLQLSLSSDIVEAVTKLRTETTERANSFEATTKKWAGALGQEAVAAKQRLDVVEVGVTERAAAQAASDKRISGLEQISEQLRITIASVDQKYNAKVSALQSQAESFHLEAMSAVKAAVARAAQDHLALQERLEVLQVQEENTKKLLNTTAAALGAKIDAVEAYAQTRAKAADVQALELRVNETIEKSLKAINEELSRKEYSTAVKAVSDRVSNLSVEVQGNCARAKAAEEALAKQVTDLGLGLAKTVRQLDADRERSNECWVSLEKEVNTKASRVDHDGAVARIAVAEETIKAIQPILASKAVAEDVKHLDARTLALERGFPLKADAAELPKLHLAIADYVAKHAAVVMRAQEHHNRLEFQDGLHREHGDRLMLLEQMHKEIQGLVGTKVDATQVYSREAADMLLKDFYRREEIDAMMTRVWWRVGDGAKMISPRHPTPMSPAR